MFYCPGVFLHALHMLLTQCNENQLWRYYTVHIYCRIFDLIFCTLLIALDRNCKKQLNRDIRQTSIVTNVTQG